MFTEVAKVDDIPEGTMQHFEHHERDIVIAHVGEEFYAMNNRCGHMKALLSMGTLQGAEIICPFHFAHFDVRTGKVTRQPAEEEMSDADQLPAELQAMMANVGRLMAPVKTHDLRTYEVKIEGDSILVNF